MPRLRTIAVGIILALLALLECWLIFVYGLPMD